MTRCIAAYAQAVKDRSIALEPNFHYNRGLAWHYQVRANSSVVFLLVFFFLSDDMRIFFCRVMHMF
ncbi:unnamed protein product [Schistosoma curassoni]|uniref:N-acetylmuramoyl-L-alanine amidase n=1 Tax=Schistosoma curassoni TaxID=6186 RepID=A0A183L7H1_9TREM|nr:unnamed protein product [Schistosoma curassoni]